MIYKYYIKIITPVHIGSGNEYGKWDFSTEGNKVFIVDINELLERNTNNTYLISHFAEDTHKNLTELLNKAKIKDPPTLYHLAGDIQNMQKLNEHIKTSGEPYIPGSSIKGAIRTAILWKLAKDKMVEVEKILKKHPTKDDEVIAILFGKDPKFDILKTLHTSDVIFNKNDLKVIQTKVLSKSDGSFKYKSIRNNPISIHNESLKEDANSSSVLRINIDAYLIEKESWFKQNSDYLKNFEHICREFAMHFIEQEIQFFKDCNCKVLRDYYEDLLKKVTKNKESIYIHLGWGIGWRSMTGNYIPDAAPDKILTKIREGERLGKFLNNTKKTKCPFCGSRGIKIDDRKGECIDCKKRFDSREIYPAFPKSRKIIYINENNLLPPGWIKLESIKCKQAS
jgi:CRISPR-associated protein Csm5